MPLLELSFESGEKSLSVRRFVVHEALSELFSVTVWALSPDYGIELDALVGKRASLHIDGGLAHSEVGERTWRGMCCHAEQIQPETRGLSTYLVRIVPELYKLGRRRNHRLFQHESIPEIVEAVLGEWDIEPTWRSKPDGNRLELRTQYGETDLAFVSRLLEEAGVSYSFADEGGATKLVLSERPEAAPPRQGPPLPCVDNPAESSEKEYVSKVRLSHEVRPGRLVLRDADFRRVDYALFGEAPPAAAPEDGYELYDYAPGAFLIDDAKGGGTPAADDKGTARHDDKAGRALAARLLEAERTGKRTVRFETNVMDLAPSTVFSVDHHPRSDLAPAKKLLVTELAMEGTVTGAWTMKGAAVFADVAYRPRRAMPKPSIDGVQSAVVVGPGGQEIHTDEFGRVRVQFPWDREGKLDDGSSCWMRVAQGWAGPAFGWLDLPRVGQEVLVAFVDGDPDQPIVVGRAYNAKLKVPYELPDNKTVSVWRSSTSPGGEGWNEIALEDAKGKELVYVQAERDLDKLVKANEIEKVGRDHVLTIGECEHLVVKKVKKELVEDASHIHVGRDRRTRVDGTLSLAVGGDLHEKAEDKHAVEVVQEIHVDAGDTVVLEADVVSLSGPGGFVRADDGGVKIRGKKVEINSGGSAKSGKPCSPAAPEDAKEATIEQPGGSQ